MLTIDLKKLWTNRDGSATSWFHPRACLLPTDSSLLMTMQSIGGSDFYGPVVYCTSIDRGKIWTAPELVPGLGRIPISGDIEEGVCDVVPDFHDASGKAVAIGHNVYYHNGRLFDSLSDFRVESPGPKLNRYPVYTVYDPQQGWCQKRRRLNHELFRNCSIYSCGCSQKIFNPQGKILIPMTFGLFDRKDRMVTTCQAEFDGDELKITGIGQVIELPRGRGLLEPSLVFHAGINYMTIRAEDDHGYVTSSRDGLRWDPIQPWCWENGTPLKMSSTQQHWLILGDKIYLIYNRENQENKNIFRWRAPLFIAEVDESTLRLKSQTEQIIIPCRSVGNDPANIPGMGNFHATQLDENEAIVTTGEEAMQNNYWGDTLLARLTFDTKLFSSTNH